MAQTLQIQQIPNDIEKIALENLQQAKGVIKDIKEILNKAGNEVENNDNNKNQIISQKIQQAAMNYLGRVDNLFNNLNNYKTIIDHQQKEFANNFKNKNSFISQLKNLHGSENYKLIIKSLYAETISFQKIVNAALGQEAITIFVLDTKDANNNGTQAFYKFDLNKESFKQFNPSLDQHGTGIKYNIDAKFFQQKLHYVQTNAPDDITKIFEHQAFLANNEFGQKFHTSLINSDKKASNGAERQQLVLSAMTKQQGLKDLFYSTYGNLRKNIPILKSNNKWVLPDFISQWAVLDWTKLDIKGQGGVYTYTSLESLKLNKDIQLQEDIIFKEGTSLRDVFNAIQSKEILPLKIEKIEFARRQFEMQGFKYNMAYVGRRGFLKEAFFGAYFGLELQDGKGKKDQFNPYLQQVDSAAGRLLGDYNIIKNGTTYAIQIKGEGARLTLWQFIALAKNILNKASWIQVGTDTYPSPNNALEYLLAQREKDIQSGRKFTKEFKPEQLAEQLVKNGIQEAKKKQ